jgi:hypothetical protein
MTDTDKHRLYRIVLDSLAQQRSRYGRQIVESAIRSAHLGGQVVRPVTSYNLPLFRQYRNDVSPDPAHLVDAATEYGLSVLHDEVQ